MCVECGQKQGSAYHLYKDESQGPALATRQSFELSQSQSCSCGGGPRSTTTSRHFGDFPYEGLVLVGPVPRRVAEFQCLVLGQLLEEVKLWLLTPQVLVPILLRLLGERSIKYAELARSSRTSICVPFVCIEEVVEV